MRRSDDPKQWTKVKSLLITLKMIHSNFRTISWIIWSYHNAVLKSIGFLGTYQTNPDGTQTKPGQPDPKYGEQSEIR